MSYSADSGLAVVAGPGVNGAFGFVHTLGRDTPGAYLICMWVADSGSDPAPVAGPQPLVVTIGAPPAARLCRVPRVTPGMRLAKAKARLRAANCVPGRVRRVSSARRRGNVVRFTPRSGTTLKPGAVVGIRISR